MGPSLSSETQGEVEERDVSASVPESGSAQTPAPNGCNIASGRSVLAGSTLAGSPSAGSSERSLPSAWGMSHGDRRVVFAFGVVAMLLMIVHWVRIVGWQSSILTVERPEGDAYRFVLEVNTATWVEWMQLDGIGETLARRIVADREARGPFLTTEDVGRVPGVGEKTLARVRAHLACEPPPDPQ